jgi:hypothetical protein
MQMVGMLFAGAVGMLRVERPIAVVMDAVNLLASVSALHRVSLLTFGSLLFGFAMRLGDVRAIPLPAAHLAESIKSISRHYFASLSGTKVPTVAGYTGAEVGIAGGYTKLGSDGAKTFTPSAGVNLAIFPSTGVTGTVTTSPSLILVMVRGGSSGTMTFTPSDGSEAFEAEAGAYLRTSKPSLVQSSTGCS